MPQKLKLLCCFLNTSEHFIRASNKAIFSATMTACNTVCHQHTTKTSFQIMFLIVKDNFNASSLKTSFTWNHICQMRNGVSFQRDFGDWNNSNLSTDGQKIRSIISSKSHNYKVKSWIGQKKATHYTITLCTEFRDLQFDNLIIYCTFIVNYRKNPLWSIVTYT